MLDAMLDACRTHMPDAMHERTNELTNADLASNSGETGSVGNARKGPLDPWERISRHIDMAAGEDGCWVWTASRNYRGYGLTHLDVDGRMKTIQAHRAVYLLKRGAIPAGSFLLHSCDNPPCVNPSHLRPGTHLENMHDRKTRGAGYPRGAEVYNAVPVSDEVVAALRAEYQRYTREASFAALGRRYGLSRRTVQSIVTRTGRWEESA